MQGPIRLCLGITISALFTSAALAAPPITEPVDVVVTNSVVPVEVSNAEPIPVSVSNVPDESIIPFARACSATADSCTIDLTALAQTGEVHITHASGAALNVGLFASPRFANGTSFVLLPPTVNSLDTDAARDIVFAQSMDLIPTNPVILFSEPVSTSVFFYLSGFVVSSASASAANATSAAKDVGVMDAESTTVP